MNGRRTVECWCVVLCQLIIGYAAVEAEYAFKMKPGGDIFLLQGSTLELNCSIANSTYDVNQIDIGRSCDIIAHGKVKNCTRFDDALFTRSGNDTGELSPQTLTLKKPNISLEDGGLYTCTYGNPPKFVTAKIVHVGDLPAKPENLSCISNNFKDLHCSASLRRSPSDIPMRWKMDYRVDGEGNSSDCSISEKTNTITCDPVTIIYQLLKYKITLVGSNDNYPAHLVTENFSIGLNYSIVKPAPVADIQVDLTNTSTEAYIGWNKPQRLYAAGMLLLYRIELVSVQNWTAPLKWFMTKKVSSPKERLTFHVSGLIPNAQYNFTISCKPSSSHGDIYWSDPQRGTFLTNIDIPGQSVSVLPGSFSYTLTNDSDVGLVLYWKNPSAKDSHGDISKYKIEIIEHQPDAYAVTTHAAFDVSIKEQTTENTESTNSYHETGHSEMIHANRETYTLESGFNSSSEYTVQVWAGNKAGFSILPAEYYIPPWNKANKLLPSWVLVEIDSERDRTLVSWSPVHLFEDSITMVAIYWCNTEQKGEFTLCEDLDWQRTEFEDNQTWIYESNNKQFAVSFETANNVSGGIVWQNLQFIYGRVPEKPTYSVNTDPGNHTVLHVTVTHGGQESYGGRPETYEIAWDKVEGGDDSPTCPTNIEPYQYPVNFSHGELELTGLQPGQEYVVCMRCSNHKGTGMFGKPVRTRTSSFIAKPQGNFKVVAVTAGVVGSLVVVLSVICAIVKYCRNKIRSVKLNNRIEDVDVVMDKFEPNPTVETIVDMKPPDQDSGTGASSTSSTDSQNQEDTEEGFVKPRSWSLVSNDSAFNQFKAKKRNSASALSGYLFVDGDSSGLLMGDDNDSLIDDDDDDEGGNGETNEYFKAKENKNVYHEIDDIKHDPVDVEHDHDNVAGHPVKLEDNSYICETEDVKTMRNPMESKLYLDTVQAPEADKLYNPVIKDEGVDRQITEKTNSLPSPQHDSLELNATKHVQIDKNQYLPADIAKKSRNSDAHLLTSEYFSECLASQAFTSCIKTDNEKLATDNKSEQVHKHETDEVMDTCVHGDTGDINQNSDEVCENTQDDYFKKGANADVADEYEIRIEDMEYSEDDFDDALDHPNDTYCNPESISLGQESTLSSGSAIQQGGSLSDGDIDYLKGTADVSSNANTTDMSEDIKDIDTDVHIQSVTANDNHSQHATIQNIAKAHLLSLEKQNDCQKVLGANTDQELLPAKLNLGNDENLTPRMQPNKANTKGKPLSESGQSYDTYVCARLNQS